MLASYLNVFWIITNLVLLLVKIPASEEKYCQVWGEVLTALALLHPKHLLWKCNPSISIAVVSLPLTLIWRLKIIRNFPDTVFKYAFYLKINLLRYTKVYPVISNVLFWLPPNVSNSKTFPVIFFHRLTFNKLEISVSQPTDFYASSFSSNTSI